MNYLDSAKEKLAEGGFTCVICGDGLLYTSYERGVKPLWELYLGKRDLSGCAAADKVVGKAAACLYILLGVKKVYAGLVSRGAVEIFKKYGGELCFNECVKLIENRSRTGICPMETAVREINDVTDAPEAIRKAFELLNAKAST